jgi:hypothetical protein
MSIFKKRRRLERIETVQKYYKSPKFALIDLSFAFFSFFVNPYRTCRKFLQKKGMQEIYAYGETPYSTYEKIVRECGIGPEDTWLELGAGRGKGCFWLAHFVQCKVIGVEWIFQFVLFAKIIRAIFRVKSVSFWQKNIETMDLQEASVIYLYGLWPDLELKKGVKVISISEPFPNCKVIKSFWIRYPWGRTRAFLQIK